MIFLALAAILAVAPETTMPQTFYDNVAMAYFDRTLKDPGAAIIQRTNPAHEGSITPRGHLFGPRPEPSPGHWACYRVNGKNSYGGYTGFKDYALFVAYGQVALAEASPLTYPGGRDRLNEVVVDACPLTDAAPTTLRDPSQSKGSAAPDLLGLVASGQCAEAREAAISAADGTRLLQVEKVCHAALVGPK